LCDEKYHRLLDGTLRCIMGIISLAFWTVLAHAYSPDLSWDNSAPDVDIFNDGAFVSSLTSTDTSDFLAGDSILMLDSSLAGPDEDPSANMFQDENSETDIYANILDSSSILNMNTPLANSNCEDLLTESRDHLAGHYFEQISPTESDDFLAKRVSAEDSSIEAGDLLADSYAEEDFSINNFDSWGPLASSDDSEWFEQNVPRKKKPPKWDPNRKIYDLKPNSPTWTETSNAYAADGTPITPLKCPRGKQKTCCYPDTDPPFSKCWLARWVNPGVCKFARNLFCCDGVERRGGAAINCEKIKWAEARDGRRTEPQPPSEPPPDASPIELDEIFPILQPIPELPNVNPGYCERNTGYKMK
jgi:hypothetical protein